MFRFDDLEGIWDFSRSFKSASDELTLLGQAEFSRVSATEYQYHEAGTYCLNGKEHSFFQNRLFCLEDPFLVIRKITGEVLHQFPLDLFSRDLFSRDLFSSEHTHHCGHDQYHCLLHWPAEERFQMAYTITGPRKGARITTVFQRKLG